MRTSGRQPAALITEPQQGGCPRSHLSCLQTGGRQCPAYFGYSLACWIQCGEYQMASQSPRQTHVQILLMRPSRQWSRNPFAGLSQPPKARQQEGHWTRVSIRREKKTYKILTLSTGQVLIKQRIFGAKDLVWGRNQGWAKGRVTIKAFMKVKAAAELGKIWNERVTHTFLIFLWLINISKSTNSTSYTLQCNEQNCSASSSQWCEV